MKRFLISALLVFACTVAHGVTITINLTDGVLSDQAGSALTDGHLIQLLASTTGTFAAPSSTSFNGGSSTDFVVQSFTLNSTATGVAGVDQTSIVLSLGVNNVAAGETLLLRWWPTFTSTSVTTPGGGTPYGEFTTASAVDGSTTGWVVPSGGATISLNFQTATAYGSQPDTAGRATKTTVVPEPSTFALAGAGLVALFAARKRRR